ncbi:hypothetical protein WJX79_010479 [Trebouxia sp. C0005]
MSFACNVYVRMPTSHSSVSCSEFLLVSAVDTQRLERSISSTTQVVWAAVSAATPTAHLLRTRNVTQKKLHEPRQ